MIRMYLMFRRARPEDMPDIEKRLHKYALDASNLDWRQFFVAESEGKMVAFGRVVRHREGYEIASMGVDYYHRKKGAGKRMFSFLLDYTKRLKPPRPIYLVTHMPDYFCKFGFEVTKNPPYVFKYKKYHICRHPSKITILKSKSYP